MLIRAPLLLIGFLVYAAGAAQASHISQSFEDATLDGDDTLQWVVLDALPSGPDDDTSPRTVHLTFDLAFDGSLDAVAPLRIVANGSTLLNTTFAHLGSAGGQAYPGVVGVDLFPAGTGSVFGLGLLYELDLTFPLFHDAPCCTDIVVVVDQPGFAGADPLVLSNINLDWSQPIPEPATHLLVAGGILGMALRRRFVMRPSRRGVK